MNKEITMEMINQKAKSNLSNDKLCSKAQRCYCNDDCLGALQIYNLLAAKVISPQDLCIINYLRGNMLECLDMKEKAIEFYKRFIYDYEQLSDSERTVSKIENLDLTVTYLDCLLALSEICMKLKQNFLASETLKKYLKVENETRLKAKALLNLMRIFTAESEYKELRKTVEEYEKLNPSTDGYENNYYEVLSYKTILRITNN